MSPFNSKLRDAQVIQRKRYALFIGLSSFACMVLALLFVYMTGTTLIFNPKEAELSGRVKVIDGFAMAVSNVIYSVSDSTRIVVSAEGFAPKTLTITGDKKGTPLPVTLQELPARLAVITRPEDTETRWKINGERVAIARSLDMELASGDYTLEADSAYYEIETRNVTLERARETRLELILRPVQGQLTVQSEPPGAKVVFDNAAAGVTPVVLAMAGGIHDLEISKEGFDPVLETITVTNREPRTERNYRLLRQSSTVTLTLKPGGGTVLANGLKIDPDQPHRLPSNEDNSLTYSLPGYVSETRTVRLKPGERKKLVFELMPDLGTVDVSTNLRAAVFVDGREAGMTPVTLKLPARAHVITLKRPGFRTVERTVVPSSQKPTALREVLQTEQQARQAEAPRTYVNKQGMTFIRFEPTSFQMGAPRHEKGQRANEFLRQIQLAKPFYAGKYETTNAQFRTFKKDHQGAGGDSFPATSVSWMEAVQFCNWLSEKENLHPFYEVAGDRVRKINTAANGYRLLSEAEWEWLARRAGRPEQTVFPWGDTATVPAMAGNIADETAKGLVPFYIPKYRDGSAGVAAVGQFAAEPSGLFDLTGNVSEWVHDTYSLQLPVSGQVETDPIDTFLGTSHVIKGSNWRSGTRTTLRAAYRDGLVDRRDDVGFRVGRYL